ncbi:SseB family protein [Kitasatospora sp. NBC_01287]|uniref:SseB family protein n=1 Tax=Kitasatospora sp. NBC_01287 TaxID=2903573 RepID=UPI002256EDE7|nr:SseB family protein [Kitasatospora sp. NBC_01287]MCX4750429.1 SseB family protein [Kitasatospora sp. NBC_01287]
MSTQVDGSGVTVGALDLARGIEAVYGGRGDSRGLTGLLRSATVLCPLVDDEPLVAESGSIRWIYAFTDEAALARFAVARGAGDRPWDFARVEGHRLLDVAVPALGGPGGVAVNVGSPAPMPFPAMGTLGTLSSRAAVAR